MLESDINLTMSEVLEWFNSNTLSVHLDKTNYMLFTTKNQLGNNLRLLIKVNNCLFGTTTSHSKFLGIWFGDKFN